MTDTQLTPFNTHHVIHELLQNVTTISNKKRKTKNKETYLFCGGGYDTESTTILDANNRPVYAFVYHVQIMINGTYLYFRHLNLLTGFLRDLSVYIENNFEDAKLIIWVANLAHEWAFFKRQLARVGEIDIFAKTERNPLKITVRKNIEFRECIGLFGRSLSHIAEQYTKTQKLKGDLSYKLTRTPETPLSSEEYAYCYNDVKILDELSFVAFEKFTKQGDKIPMTQTGILRQKCKKAIKNIASEYIQNAELMPETEQLYYMFRKYLYNGGLSGSNILYIGRELKDRVKCADITSDYPAQLNHERFPAGKLVECSPDEIEKYKYKFRIFDVLIGKLSAKTEHAIYSKHKVLNWDDTKNAVVNNGKIQHIENVRIMINDVDLSALLKVYDMTDFTILRCWYFTEKKKAPKFLLDTMNEYYKIKCDLKRKLLTETIEYKEAKAFVNSFYGMTVTKLYNLVYNYDENKMEITGKNSEKTYDELKQKMWLNPYIGYWCTSYARKILIDLIAEYPECIIQYDTDSIYYLCDLPTSKALEKTLEKYNNKMKDINNAIFNDELFVDLGAWDIESEPFKRFKCLGAKRYIYENKKGIKPVVAGLPKKAFLKYVTDNKIDAFSLFKNNMTLDRVSAEKLASAYNDTKEIKLVRIIDYLGVESVVKIGTYHALFAVEFTMKMAKYYVELAHQMELENAYPQQYKCFT